MNRKIYIGIDNGPTGSIGVITPDYTKLQRTIKISQQDFTKKKQNISRLDRTFFQFFLMEIIGNYPKININEIFVAFERPFWNPMLNSQSSKSAIWCLADQLAIIEDLMWPHNVYDSKNWQKGLLPEGIKGTKDLKKASLDIGIRLFPNLEEEIKKQKDADGILLAEWARRNNL